MLKHLISVCLAYLITPAVAGLVAVHHAATTPPPVPMSVACIPTMLTASAVPGSVVCPITLSPSNAAGALALTGVNASSFLINGSNLVVGPSALPAGSYQATVTATSGTTVVSTNLVESVAPSAGAQFPAPDLSSCNFTTPTSFGHVWYIDPVNGFAENDYTNGTNGAPTVAAIGGTSGQGTATHPWNSLQAVFGTNTGQPVTGYTHILLASGRTHQGQIAGGDEVLLMTGTASQYGAISTGSFGFSINNSSYVTIAAAPGQTPVLTNMNIQNIQNLVFRGITVQSTTLTSGHLVFLGSNGGAFGNVVLDNISVMAQTDATVATYVTTADWTAGVFGNAGVTFGAAPCSKLTNSHLRNVDSPIQMANPNKIMISNNEISYFLDDGIDYEGFNVVITGNYIHDFINLQNGAHIDGMQGDGNEVLNGNILIDSNKIIQTTTPSKPFATASVGWDAGITITNNQWSYLTITNNIVIGSLFTTGIGISNCNNCMVANNTVPDEFVRCTPLNLGSGGVYANTNIQVKNNLVSAITARFPSGAHASDPAGCLMANNVIFNGGAGGNQNSFNCNGVTVDVNSTATGTYACGNKIDAGGVSTELTTFNDAPTYTYNVALLSTAPARGAGTSAIPTPQVDYAGNVMNVPPDVGALQFGTPVASNPVVAMPTGDVLHYISPTGNDANNGTSPSTPWATTNHAMHCGDVIVAAVGNYSPLQTWGAVTNCPSTTGGIDGKGGLYFASLICAGNVGTCSVNHPTGHDYGMDVNASNWAVEGWLVSEGYVNGASGFGFTIEVGSNQLHHTAFINDVSTFNAGGFTSSTNTGTLNGYDYVAIIGDIAQNSAGRNDCCTDAAVDMVTPKNWDTASGTHIIIDGVYSYNNQQTTGGPADGECYMFDTLDDFSYSQAIYMANSYCAISERYGLQFFYQAQHVSSPTITVVNNSFYGSNICAFNNCGGGNFGDIDLAGTPSALPWLITLNNNLVSERLGHPTGQPTGNIYALLVGGTYQSSVTIGSGSNANFMKGLAGVCGGFSCDAGFNVTQFNGGSFGTSTYVNPGYTNVTDLFNNQIGTPDCTAYENVAQCMGYDAKTNTMTTPSFISDFVATASGTAGKGAQLPSVTCAVNPFYPAWLKGIVYLHWNSVAGTVTENSGLVTKPCGL